MQLAFSIGPRARFERGVDRLALGRRLRNRVPSPALATRQRPPFLASVNLADALPVWRGHAFFRRHHEDVGGAAGPRNLNGQLSADGDQQAGGLPLRRAPLDNEPYRLGPARLASDPKKLAALVQRQRLVLRCRHVVLVKKPSPPVREPRDLGSQRSEE